MHHTPRKHTDCIPISWGAFGHAPASRRAGQAPRATAQGRPVSSTCTSLAQTRHKTPTGTQHLMIDPAGTENGDQCSQRVRTVLRVELHSQPLILRLLCRRNAVGDLCVHTGLHDVVVRLRVAHEKHLHRFCVRSCTVHNQPRLLVSSSPCWRPFLRKKNQSSRGSSKYGWRPQRAAASRGR